MWYDIAILVFLIFATVRGAVKGFVWQLAVIAAVVLCFGFSGSLSIALAPMVPVKPPLNRWIAMFVLYVLFSFVSFGTARWLRDWIEKARFVEYDRHLGAIFGLIKGVTISLVVTFFVVTLSESARQHVLQSRTGHAAAVIMDRLHPVMPRELHDVLEPYIHQLDRPGMQLRYSHSHADAGHPSHDDRHAGHVHESSEADAGESSDAVPVSIPHDASPPADAEQGDESLENVASNLAGGVDGELTKLVIRALANTSAENRDELMEKLSVGVPGLVRSIAQEWQNGKPAADPEPSPERSRLLKEIAGVYSQFPEAQAAIVDEVELSLTGLPNRVEFGVISDWHADLLATDADPDPETDITTPLDMRILRQLSANNVPMTSLSSSLQSRLRESLPR